MLQTGLFELRMSAISSRSCTVSVELHEKSTVRESRNVKKKKIIIIKWF